MKTPYAIFFFVMISSSAIFAAETAPRQIQSGSVKPRILERPNPLRENEAVGSVPETAKNGAAAGNETLSNANPVKQVSNDVPIFDEMEEDFSPDSYSDLDQYAPTDSLGEYPAEYDTTTLNAPPVEPDVDRSATVTPKRTASSSPSPMQTNRGAAVSGGKLRNIEGRNPRRPQEGTGMPGPSSLEGPQAAQVVIEKIYPQEVQIGQVAEFKIVVKNVGQTTATDVIVRDLIPQGSQLVSTNPATTPNENGELVWNVGSLESNGQTTIEMELVPLSEGEIGSVASVQFNSEASGKTRVTRAMLTLEALNQPEVLIGQEAILNISISNPGTGTAKGVKIEFKVPKELSHSKGTDLVFNVGELKPGETKQLPLKLQSLTPGQIPCLLSAKGENNLTSVTESIVSILAPELKLQISGPKQRYLERKAAYSLTVSNPGTADARDIDLIAYLPAGLKFESTNQSGVYDPQAHRVVWALEELPSKSNGEIELITVPIESGEQTIKFEGVGRGELKADTQYAVNVEGLSALSFEVLCLSDPVEVGKTATYEIKVTNRGTKASKNVGISVRLSEGMQFASAEGPTKHKSDGRIVKFAPLSTIDAKQDRTYKFTAKCLQAGDNRISVSVTSDDRAPITKEESTQVFE
ncbi:MAG: hypothetical protein ACRC2T_09095 [Thermoguttaceae bacterium]